MIPQSCCQPRPHDEPGRTSRRARRGPACYTTRGDTIAPQLLPLGTVLAQLEQLTPCCGSQLAKLGEDLRRLRDIGRRAGFTHAELSWIREVNVPMGRVIEGVGAVAYKRLRIYDKPIGG